MALILVVDDERSMREFLEIFLARQGHEIHTAEDGNEAFDRLSRHSYDLVITDLKMPGGPGGMEVLEKCRELSPDTQVIMMTAYSTTETALQAMKKGAYDYIEKPFKVKEASVVIEKALEKRDLLLTNQRLKKAVSKQFSFDSMVGKSPSMREVFQQITRIADTRTNVIVFGESGTGKELVARALHYSSSRADKPLVVVNCGAIPDNLMESELFGHVKGSFTGAISDKKGLFEAAQGGTLFLDEIGELSLHLQVKLLRAVQERRIKRIGGIKEVDVDVRVLAATNKDLEHMVKQGTFRDDLYFRLNVIQLNLPALRERREDIPLLAQHFLEKYNLEIGKRLEGFTQDSLEILACYDYPGNIRELENIIQRAVAFEQTPWITPESLPRRVAGEGSAKTGEIPGEVDFAEGFNLDEYIEDIELRLLKEGLQRSQGNVTEAARLLGISFRAMRYKLSKYGMRKEEFIE